MRWRTWTLQLPMQGLSEHAHLLELFGCPCGAAARLASLRMAQQHRHLAPGASRRRTLC